MQKVNISAPPKKLIFSPKFQNPRINTDSKLIYSPIALNLILKLYNLFKGVCVCVCVRYVLSNEIRDSVVLYARD